MKFLFDKPVNLKDIDFLNSLSYAKTLKEAIINSPENESFIIGLFGEWGSGKSSIIDTVKDDLEKGKRPKIKFIVYDAWKYVKDSFRRMFLLKVLEELKFEKSPMMEKFYSNKNEDIEVKPKFNINKFTILILIVIAGLLLINMFPDKIDFAAKLNFSFLLSFVGIAISSIFKIFDELKVSVQSPRIFAPEQFEECFNEMVNKSLKKNNFICKAFEFVKGKNYVRDIDKLVVVIDNIDRCDKETAYKLLTYTKSFLTKTKDVIFVIPVDDKALKDHIKKANSSEKESEEFLRKFFNVTIRIKPLKAIEIKKFTEDINSNYNYKYKPDTLDIISNEFATNPRRIIQFYNNLEVETHNLSLNFGEYFVEENESLICKLLIIKEEWPNFYNFICKNPNNLNSESSQRNDCIKDNFGLQVFLENTYAISKNVNVEIINKIVSNSTVFSSLSNELISYVFNKTYKEAEEYFSSNSMNFELLYDYLIENLRIAVDSEKYLVSVIRIFQILLLLNRISKLNVTFNNRIENIIEKKLNNFIPLIEHVDDLTLYCDYLMSLDIDYLNNYLIGLINEKFSSPDDKYDKYGNDLIYSYIKNISSVNSYIRIKDSFAKYYISGPLRISNFVSEDKTKELLTDVLIEYVIESLSNIPNDDWAVSEIKYISTIYQFDDDQKEKIFLNINSSYANFKNFDLSMMIKHVEKFTPLISNIDMIKQKDKTQFTIFYNNIFSNRIVGGQTVNLIREVLQDETAVDVVIKFLYNVYKSTHGQQGIISHFTVIANSSETNQIKINNSILMLYKNDVSLKEFVEIIINDESYDTSTFELLEIIFKQKLDDKFILNDSQLKIKLTSMTKLIFDKFNISSSVNAFLEKMIKENRIKDALTDIIRDSSKEEIILLSDKLLHLAYDVLTENDNLFDYEDNIELLCAIGESGEKRHLVKLANVIVSKLQKSDSREEAFKILEREISFNGRDSKKIINILEDFIENENYKEKALSIIDKLKNNVQ